MINDTVTNELDRLNTTYENCVTRPQHGNYYENTLIHICIDRVLDSWDDNNGEPFIGLVRAIDKKLKEIIISFDWIIFRL